MGNLKEIALELLDKYKDAAESAIYQYSLDIEEDLDYLYSEVDQYKKQIGNATK